MTDAWKRSGMVLNLSETAEYLRVSNQTVYNMIRAGRIKAHKVGREWRFLKADIEAYLESTSSSGFDRVCPTCRADIEDGWRYCPYCGQNVPLNEEG